MIQSIFARKQAVLRGSTKRVVSEDGSDLGYDLVADPREEHPFPGWRTRLVARVPEPKAGADASELSEAQRTALQTLGYIE